MRLSDLQNRSMKIPLEFRSVDHLSSNMLMVYFSDATFLVITVQELAAKFPDRVRIEDLEIQEE
jgi:hypothetical protein